MDEPRRMSLYSFSLNNPVRYMDPDGRDSKEVDGKKLDETVVDNDNLDRGNCEGAVEGLVCIGTITGGEHEGEILYNIGKKESGAEGGSEGGEGSKVGLLDRGLAGALLDWIGIGSIGLINIPVSVDTKKAFEGAMIVASVIGVGIGATGALTKIGNKLGSKASKLWGKWKRKCFAAGTLVETSDGFLPIEDVQIGDLVWSKDDETGEEGWKPVVQIFKTPNSLVVDLDLLEADGDRQELFVTPEHPLYSMNGWLAVGDLKVGDQVWAREGWAEVLSIEATAQVETVYNFEVAGFHTYFVGEGGVWAHNTCQKAAAKVLGFDRRISPRKAPFDSHGQQVFFNGKRYITKDIDGHNGGVWKMFNRRGKRMGTYDKGLVRIKD